MAQTINNLPEMQETWVRSLIWEEPLKKGMATHSSILAEKIPWTEEPGGATIHGVTESDLTERLTFFFHMNTNIFVYMYMLYIFYKTCFLFELRMQSINFL